MNTFELAAAIRCTANALIGSHHPPQPSVQTFCITSTLGALVDLATDYGLDNVRRQLLDGISRIQRGRHARPIEEEAIS
jgi:hypothetical protein